MEEAISRSNHRDRKEELERKNSEVRGVLQDLVAMCLEDIRDKLKRTKIETLVTIQVHQRDLYGEIGRATSELQSRSDLVCRLLLEKKNIKKKKKQKQFIN